MYWNTKSQPLTPLPKTPLCLSLHDSDESILYSGFFYKRHPLFTRSYTPRLLIFTPTRFIWADGADDQVVPKRQFRRGRIHSIKPASGPKYLPGISIQIDEKHYIFTHDDPLKVDKLTNFIVSYTGNVEDWPDYNFYEPQRPVIKIGVTVPGERTQYPEVAYRSNPVFTPAQIALIRGSRVFCQGLIFLNKQRCRFVVSNEIFTIFDDSGDAVVKFSPLEVTKLIYNGQQIAVNSLEFNKQRDLTVEVSGELLNLFNDPQSQCQWNGALASFLGILPSLDCIKNVENYAQEESYFRIFEDVDRVENLKQRIKDVKDEDDESSDDDYVTFQGEGEIQEAENEIVEVLIHDIVEQEEKEAETESESANSSILNKSLVEQITKNTRISFHASGARKSKSKEQMQKMQTKLQKKEKEYIKQVQDQIEQLNKEIENQSSDSFQQSDTPELDIQELQDKAVVYSLQTLTKVLDHAEHQYDPEMNTWDLLVPYYEEQQPDPEYQTLVDEAAQVRRKILFTYAKQLSQTSDGLLSIGTIPEPFGDIFEFIDKIEISTPKNIDPASLGIAFPASDVISERAKFVRGELVEQFHIATQMYSELVAFLRAYLDLEYEHRRDNQERYHILDPHLQIRLKLHRLVPTYLKYFQEPEELTAFQVYKIFFWYSENVGNQLASELRKLIAQETLLSVNNSNSIVRNAAQDFLQDGDIFELEEAQQFIQELSCLNQLKKQQFYAFLDAENSTFYGQNLHIFGANERIRRASQILIQAVFSRLESRIIRQFFYFGSGKIDLKTDLFEAEKYISLVDNQGYCMLLTEQHRFHINQAVRAILYEIYYGYCRIVHQMQVPSLLSQKFNNISVQIDDKEWSIRGEYLLNNGQYYKQRGTVVEGISGSRPDEQLPAKQFLYFFGQQGWFCKILEGPKLRICAEFLLQQEIDKYTISIQGRELTIELKDQSWVVDNNIQIPGSVNILQIIFMHFYDKFDDDVEIDMNTTLFRLMTFNSPLDEAGSEYREKQDREEEGALTYCQEVQKRETIKSSDEIAACMKVFQEQQ